ncbi:unnamed protein product [Brugia timori]|uniref:Uncharacterized protein n=1 Tax=Brugia timori TaxID=42155 RepID=A0A0R3QXC7_9BILA|nr:unnamed protein product [Brugia timori]
MLLLQLIRCFGLGFRTSEIQAQNPKGSRKIKGRRKWRKINPEKTGRVGQLLMECGNGSTHDQVARLSRKGESGIRGSSEIAKIDDSFLTCSPEKIDCFIDRTVERNFLHQH